MRIAIHDYAGFPFSLELSRELSRRGHSLLHLYTQASGGPKLSAEDDTGRRLEILNIEMDAINKDHFVKRWAQERRYGVLAVERLNRWQPDVVLSANTPLMAQKKIIDWAAKRTIPSIFWLHDLLSVAAQSVLSATSPSLGHLAFRYFNRIEIDALSKSSHIVAVTEDFEPILEKWQIDPEKISVIPNWGPIEKIPVLPRANPFSDRYGLTDKFVVLYAGTVGIKQGIRLIAGTVKKLSDETDILFVVATDNRGHDHLSRQIAGKKLSNLLQLPLQSASRYPYLLASADVTLVALEKSAGDYCVPSKLWSSYCAQKPSIIAVQRHNQCARITEKIAAGVVISPDSVDECAAAIQRLKKNESKRLEMGASARHYAERHFPISKIAVAFEAVLHKIAVTD